MSTWYVYEDDARGWTAPPMSADAQAFHQSLPGYAPTPLIELPGLAAELGVGRVLVEDESARLGLPAFKILGASWACQQVQADQLLVDLVRGEAVHAGTTHIGSRHDAAGPARPDRRQSGVRGRTGAVDACSAGGDRHRPSSPSACAHASTSGRPSIS